MGLAGEWDHTQSVKEFLRHFAYKARLGAVLGAVSRRRGFKTAHFEHATPAERFAAVYRDGVWVHGHDRASLSGDGAELTATTQLRQDLPCHLRNLGCQTLLDIGCGDWNWMREVDLPCVYVGCDIVGAVIDANRAFERPGVSFQLLDAIAGPLPRCDVALCREVLFHLSFKDALAVLSNIRPAAEWLIATTDNSIWFNSDIPSGHFRKLNLQRSPFSLPPPLHTIVDDAVSKGRMLGVWRTADLTNNCRAL